MANEKKEEIRQARLATDSMVRELQQTVEALPRTDHMTLPAISIGKIDDETRARMEAIASINVATDPEAEIGDKTLQQIRNEFEFGVSDLKKEGGKHQIIVSGKKGEEETITVIPPVVEVTTAEGVKEVEGEGIKFQPTPANIAPIDADAPKNPVEAKEEAGLKPTSTVDPITIGTPLQPLGVKVVEPKEKE